MVALRQRPFARQEASLLQGSVSFCCPLRGCVLDGTPLLRVRIGRASSASREMMPLFDEKPEEKFDHMASAMRSEVPSCPYCVSGSVFREMKALENGRHMCEECGHIAFPGDSVLWCPCPKCLEGRFAAHCAGFKSVSQDRLSANVFLASNAAAKGDRCPLRAEVSTLLL